MAVSGKQLLSVASRRERERDDDDLEQLRSHLTPGKSTRSGSLLDRDHADHEQDNDHGGRDSAGESLPADLARRLAAELDVDVHDVRIHTDERAAAAAAALSATAFSIGKDIYFAAGAYQPDTEDGERLIARELVHIGHGRSDSDGRPSSRDAEESLSKAQRTKVDQGDPGALVDHVRNNAQRIELPFVRELEEHFETTFDYVEAYTGEAAELACRLMEAGAFAVRNVVAFADPSPQRDTLMHELTHVIQAGGRAARAPAKFGAGSLNVGAPGTHVEHEASAHVARPTVNADIHTVHRQGKGTATTPAGSGKPENVGAFADGLKLTDENDKSTLKWAFKTGERATSRYYAAASFDLATYTKNGRTKADLDAILQDAGRIKGSKTALRLHQAPGKRYVVSRDTGTGYDYQPNVVEVSVEDRWKKYKAGLEKIPHKITFTWQNGGKGAKLQFDEPAINEPEFGDYREAMRKAIAAAYAKDNTTGVYDVFYKEVVCAKEKLFPIKTTASIFEELVALCSKNGVVGVTEATAKIPVWDESHPEHQEILAQFEKHRLDGDGVVKVKGDTVAITEAKAYRKGGGPTDSDTKKMSQYARLIRKGKAIPGYVNYAEPLGVKPVTFNHAFYNIAAPAPTGKKGAYTGDDRATLQLWLNALGKYFGEPYDAASGGNPETWSMHPKLDGSYKFLVKFNPEFEFEVPPNTKSINLTNPPGDFVPGLKISKVQASVNDQEMITGGEVVYSIDAGDLKKPAQTKPLTPTKDGVPGGQVDNKVKGLSSKLADVLPVEIDAAIVDGGVEATISLKQGAVKGLAGFTVDSAVIKATYLQEGTLTAEGEINVHHQNGKLSAKVKVTYDTGWGFEGKVTLTEGLIPGVKGIDGLSISRSSTGEWKIGADSFDLEQKIGAVTVTGHGSALEYDVHTGMFKGDLDVNADLGMFGTASGSASIVNNKLAKGSISYDSPEFTYPAKSDKPAFKGTVGGTLKYNEGKLSGDIRGSANIAIPALQKIAGDKGIALDVDGHIDEAGAFSGTVKSTNPLKFGKYLEIPSLSCTIAKDGALSGDFAIKVVNIKYLEKAEVACTVTKDGITVHSAAAKFKFGNEEKGQFWGELSVDYDEKTGLDISGTVNYKIKDDMIAVGTLKYDQATNAVTLVMKVKEIPLVDKTMSKTLFTATKQIPVVNVWGLGVYIDIGFELGFDFGFKVTVAPEVDFVGLSLDTWKFEKIAAKLVVGGDIFAQLTGTPKLGLGVFALDPSIIRGGGGLKIPIVGRLDIKPSGNFGVDYKPDGGVTGSAKMGFAGQFGITGSLRPYAEFSVLNDMWNPKWTGDPLTSFEILKPKELFNFTVDIAGDNKDLKDGPKLPEKNEAQAPTEPAGDRTAKATPGTPEDKGQDANKDKPATSGEVTENGDQGPFSLESLLEKFKGNQYVATADKIFRWGQKVWKFIKPIYEIVQPVIKLIGQRIEAIIDLFDTEAPTGDNIVPWLWKLAGKLYNVMFGGITDMANAIKALWDAGRKFAKNFITKSVESGQIGVRRSSYYIWMPWPKDNIEFMAAAEWKINIPGIANLGHHPAPGFLLRPSGAVGLVLYEALELIGLGYTNTANSDINEPYNDIWYPVGERP